MHHSDFAAAALLKLRAAARKPAPAAAAGAPAEPAHLTGASFIELEPDLAKESGQRARDVSGWSASGQPPSE